MAALVAAAVVVLLVRFLAPTFFVRAAAPFFAFGSSISHGIETVGAFFADRSSLVAQRDAALAAQQSLAAEDKTLATKFADLTALLGARTEAPPGVLAAVLARPPVAPYDELVIDAGSDQGIVQGALVSGNNGVPVGTVSSVTARNARVALYSMPGRQTSALIGASKTPVTLTGQGGGAFSASVPRDAGVAVGDSVLLEGSGSLAIGSVAAVDANPSSPTAVVQIKPFVNPYILTWVTVAP